MTTTCIQPGNDVNIITEMRYGPGGQLVALVAKNPATGDQVTRYEYGLTLGESQIASNDLLRAEIYPDASDSSDRISYAYNRQGQRTRLQDQNGSVHEYEHDGLGRQTADRVTVLGAGVDGAVRRIGQSYEVRGLVEKVTSYSDAGGTTVVNEVQNAYNSFAQLVAQYQEHEGSVNTSTTPKVEYGYADGSANTVRKTNMTYPSGHVLEYLYDDEAADKLSRVRTLEWDAAEVCQYSYLGLATFVTTDYLQPQVKLDYALGSGANPYTGFDRFGRIIDLMWKNYGADEELVHLKYGYDQASNRTYREDLVAQSYDKDFDELYEYDSLHRLKKFHRGRLTDDNRAIVRPTLQQSWQLDATGNWENFTQNDQGDASQALDQQRLPNRVNEIVAISRTVGAEWFAPVYDRNGNMTLMLQPKEPTLPYRATWDAWNRLVRLEEPGGEAWQLVQTNAYDGLKRRTAAEYPDSAQSFLYTSDWQIVSEAHSGSSDEAYQYLWGLRYIDDLVLRDGDETTYAFQDANWNVVAIGASEATSRFAYEAYGLTIAWSPDFMALINIPKWNVTFSGYQTLTRELEDSVFLVRNRELNCALGLWLSRDPAIALQTDTTLQWHTDATTGELYRYVESSPLSFVDPQGLSSEPHYRSFNYSNALGAILSAMWPEYLLACQIKPPKRPKCKKGGCLTFEASLDYKGNCPEDFELVTETFYAGDPGGEKAVYAQRCIKCARAGCADSCSPCISDITIPIKIKRGGVTYTVKKGFIFKCGCAK